MKTCCPLRAEGSVVREWLRQGAEVAANACELGRITDPATIAATRSFLIVRLFSVLRGMVYPPSRNTNLEARPMPHIDHRSQPSRPNELIRPRSSTPARPTRVERPVRSIPLLTSAASHPPTLPAGVLARDERTQQPDP